MQITDTSAVVTGGASGLGAATAAALVERGARVFALDLPDSIDKAERREGGATGPEMGEAPEPVSGVAEFVWFSPSKGRTVTTPGKTPPAVDGIDDWTLISEPPAGGA